MNEKDRPNPQKRFQPDLFRRSILENILHVQHQKPSRRKYSVSMTFAATEYNSNQHQIFSHFDSLTHHHDNPQSFQPFFNGITLHPPRPQRIQSHSIDHSRGDKRPDFLLDWIRRPRESRLLSANRSRAQRRERRPFQVGHRRLEVRSV